MMAEARLKESVALRNCVMKDWGQSFIQRATNARPQQIELALRQDHAGDPT
jgi:hypothetical protein